MNSMIRTAALATALLLTTTLAAQANALNDHWKRPKVDPMTTQGINDSTSPGDPFFPDRPTKPDELVSPEAPHYEAECRFADPIGDYMTITYVNTGNETIPAGTWLIASWDENGNGPSETLVNDLKPGESITVKINISGVYDDRYAGKTCDVWLYAGTGPLPTHPL